jgi:hypothetical protein
MTHIQPRCVVGAHAVTHTRTHAQRASRTSPPAARSRHRRARAARAQSPRRAISRSDCTASCAWAAIGDKASSTRHRGQQQQKCPQVTDSTVDKSAHTHHKYTHSCTRKHTVPHTHACARVPRQYNNTRKDTRKMHTRTRTPRAGATTAPRPSHRRQVHGAAKSTDKRSQRTFEASARILPPG